MLKLKLITDNEYIYTGTDNEYIYTGTDNEYIYTGTDNEYILRHSASREPNIDILYGSLKHMKHKTSFWRYKILRCFHVFLMPILVFIHGQKC